MQETEPKILIYDIEVSPALGWFYPPLYRTNILEVDMHQVLISVSWVWYEEGKKTSAYKVKNVKLPDFKVRYKADQYDDEDVARKLHKLLDEADIVVGHNSNKFDNKMANAFFLKHDLEPVSPYKKYDTCASARRCFKFASNSLNELSKMLKIGQKSDEKVGALWHDCVVKKDKKAWKLLEKYNDQDIKLTLELYKKLRAYDRYHPNLSRVSQKQGVCPTCQKSTAMERRGYAHRANGKVQRYKCMVEKGGCGRWSQGRYVAKEERVGVEDRPDIVNST